MKTRTLTLIAMLIVGAAGCAKNPRVTLQVSRDRIQQGEDVQVTWTSKDAKTVTLNDEVVDKAGSKVFTPDQTTTYTLVGKRGKKEARASKTVAVLPRPPRPIVSIVADPDLITRGQSSTLKWSSANADRVEITGLGTVPASGSRLVSPSQSTTYTATATGPGGSAVASARVTVTEPEPEAERPRTVSSPTIASLFAQWVKPIFFDFDKAELRPEAKEALRRAAQWLTQAPNRTIIFRIEGNCDPRGTEEYNIGLGERRAQAAKEFLVSLGVDPSRIQTISYGESKAQGTYEGTPDNPPSWAHDRRDDFVYISGGTAPRNPEPAVLLLDIR
jgi:peptidoglycan-associated lipoprotein